LGLCFVPVISSTVAMALVWRLLYAPQYGQINAVLGILGLPTQSFLRDVSQALFSIAGVGVWKVAGLGIVIFLAGLREVPEVLYEAARIDGASLWASFRYITMPLLKRVLTFQLVMTILWGMQTFALVYVMIPGTPGGPGHATNTIVLYIYKVGIRGLNLGHAASMGIVLFLILFVLAAIQLKLLSTKWEY